jgi:hypothetical protein
MPYADIFLVYDLLGAAIAREQLDVAQYVRDRGYTRSAIFSCLCALWREGLIGTPAASFAEGEDGVIFFDEGASAYGSGLHRLLRETVLISLPVAPGGAVAGASTMANCDDQGAMHVAR